MAERYGVEAIFTAKDEISNPISKIRKALSGVTESTQKVSAGFGTLLKGSAVFSLASKGVDMLRDSISGAVSRFDTLNNFPKIMKIMGASTQDSTAAINKLKDGVNGLPTSLDTVARTTENLFPAVGNDVRKAADSTLALNDAFIASGASSEDAARGLLQYTQMLSTGKVDMMSWRSLEETMPYALQKVAKSFGITSGSMSELYSKVQSGQITMKQLNDRFIELDGGVNGFHQAALSATGGIGTAMANMKNRVTAGVTDIIGAFDKMIEKATGLNISGWLNVASTNIKSFLDSIAGRIEKFADTFQKMFEIIKNSFAPVISAWKQAISSVVDAFTILYAESNKTEGLNTFKSVIQTIADILVKLANFVQENSVEIAKLAEMALKASVGFLAFKKALQIGNAVVQPFLGLAEGISNLNTRIQMFIGQGPIWEEVLERTQKKGDTLKSGLDRISDGFNNVKGRLAESKNAFSNLDTNIATSKQNIENFESALKNRLATAFAPAKKALSDFATTLKNGITSATQSALDAIKKFGTNLGQALASIPGKVKQMAVSLGEAIASIPSKVRSAVDNISQALSAIPGKLKALSDSIITALSSIPGKVRAIADSISQAVLAIPDKVQSMLVAMQQKINSGFQLLQTQMTNVANNIAQAFNSLTGKMKSIANSIVSAFKELPAKISEFTLNAVTSLVDGFMSLPGKLKSLGNSIIQGFISLPAKLGALGTAAGRAFVNGFNAAKNGISSFFSALRSGITSAMSVLSSGISSGMSAVVNVFNSAMATITGTSVATGTAVTAALGPISLVILAIGAVVGAFAVMWNTNFMNIRNVVSSFVSGIISSFTSMGSTINSIVGPIVQLLSPLKVVLQAIAMVIGGALMAALATVMITVATAVDTIRAVITGIATIVITIKALISAIAAGADAVGKFFKGDFVGAAQSANKAVGSIKDGVNDIGKAWKNFADNSATKNTVNSLRQIGDATDDDKTKAEQFAKTWSSASKSIQSNNDANKESFNQVGQAMQSAFSSNDGMKSYVEASNNLMTSWSDKQIAIQKRTSSLMAQAEKASGDEQRKLRAAAIKEMLTDQSNGAKSMQNIMDENNKMLIKGVATNGQKLTDEQKQALRTQNEAVRQALTDRADMELKALQMKRQNNEKFTKEDTRIELEALKQKNQAVRSQLEENAQTEQDLKKKLASATTEVEKASYQQQLDALKQSNKDKQAEANRSNQQMLQSLSQAGKLNHQTYTKALNDMVITTGSGMQAVLGELNKHSATIWERLQVVAQYFGQTGKKGTQDFLNAVINGDYQAAGAKMNAEVLASLKQLPKGMFKGGSDGKNQFINALKNGKYEAAGGLITDSTSKGITKGQGKVKSAAKKTSEAGTPKADTKKAKSEGAKVSDSYASGIKSKSKNVEKAAKDIPKQATSGLKTSSKTANSAGKELSSNFASGIKNGAGNAKSAGTSVASSAVSGLKSKASSGQSAGKSIAQKMAEGIKSVRDQVKSAGNSLGSAFVSAVKSKSSSAHSAGRSIANSAVSGARTGRSGMESAGYYLAAGLASGIRSNSGAVQAAAESAVASAVAAAKRKADIHSPSRVMRDQVGQWLAKGIASGIDDYSDDAQNSAQNLIAGVQNTLSNTADLNVGANGQVSLTTSGSLMGLLQNIKQLLADNNQVIIEKSAQPANISLSLGGSDFDTFVEDISRRQDVQVALRKKRL